MKVLSILVLIVILSCSKNDKGNEGVKYLKEINNVEGSSIFPLANPRNIKLNSNYLYISNYGKDIPFKILKYNIIDEKIEFGFAGNGRGPSEIQSQNLIDVYKNEIYIDDISSRKMGVYETNGKYVRSFYKPDPYYEYIINDTSIYHFGAEYLFSNVDKSDNSLIKISSNKTGTIISQFGNMLNFINDMPEGMSMPIIRVYENKVFVLFKYFPILRIYDMKGELIKDVEISNPAIKYKNLVDINYRPENFANPFAPKIKYLFTSFKIINDRIFVGVNSPENLVIDEFTLDGEYLFSHISKKKSVGLYLIDFEVSQTDSETKFYIAYHDIYPKIGVFNYE